MKRYVNRALPVGSKRRMIAKTAYDRLRGRKKPASQIDYSSWIKTREPDQFSHRGSLKKGPLISIVVPAYNTPDKYIKPLVESMLKQTYHNWQLCVSDASTNPERAASIKRLCDQDERIVYVQNEGLHISANTNEAIRLAQGKFVGLLDHDDTLSPHALYEVALTLKDNPNTKVIYSDEDKLSDDGKTRQLPFFKPSWSPDLLLGVNYITHFLVVKSTLLRKVGGLRSEYDGAQDYDLLLRLTEQTDQIVHIPKILYHWRLADGSTAKVVGEKSYADTAGQKALKDAVKRRGISASVVEIPERPTNYRLRYSDPSALVSIIIPFKDKVEYLKKLIPSITQNSKGAKYEIILVSNNSTQKETHDYLASIQSSHKQVKVFEYNEPFNYSAVNNFGRKQAKGEVLVFLNNDTEILSEKWLQELSGVAVQEGVGAVGPMLLYPNNTIQHAGVTLGMNTMAGHPFRHRKPGEPTEFGLPDWPRNYLAVTGACLAIEASKFDTIGGFDESIIIAGSDVALCLRLHEANYRNVYWPFVLLYHYENVSVGSYDNGLIGDYKRSREYYEPYLNYKDPYFNPNLDLMNESIAIRSSYDRTRK